MISKTLIMPSYQCTKYIFDTKRSCIYNDSIVKYIRNFGKITKLSLENEWLKADPMRKIKLTLQEVNKSYLNFDDLTALMNKKVDIPSIAQVRDVFVFCCFTGLAYIVEKTVKLTTSRRFKLTT